MLELKGKYNTCKVFADIVEEEACSQIINMMNQPFSEDSRIRIMADTHAGKGCTIGTTMTIKDKVVPNLVGVDIGCGMLVVKLAEKEIDFAKLDETIRKVVPLGFNVRAEAHKFADEINIKDLFCGKSCNLDRAYVSIGTLGGGNHFIEVDKDENGSLFLVIHTGSRNLGIGVADYWQDAAYKNLSIGQEKEDLNQIMEKLKKEGRKKEIEKAIKDYKLSKWPKIEKTFAYCSGDLLTWYIHDMEITQQYAHFNRKAIADSILSSAELHEIDEFETVHNYIDTNAMILRKGAVSAKTGERLIIPMNMRDGSLICIGKGNEDYNFSAPHGAGRLMSRSKAKETLSMDTFHQTMDDAGIFTTSVEPGTLDESPMAYKPMQSIIDNIKDTVEIVKIIKPVYNLKASE